MRDDDNNNVTFIRSVFSFAEPLESEICLNVFFYVIVMLLKLLVGTYWST